MPHGFFEHIIMPQSRAEAVGYLIDGVGTVASIMFLSKEIYMTTMGGIVIMLTAISLGITIIKKLYDLHKLLKDDWIKKHEGGEDKCS